MHGISSFVISAIVAAQVSAQEQDNQIYGHSTAHGRGSPYVEETEPVYSTPVHPYSYVHEPIDAFVETPLGYGGLHHVSPDYAIHYNPGYYVPVHPPPVHHDQLFSYEEYQHEQKSGDKKTHEKESGDRKKQSKEKKQNSDVTEGHQENPVLVHHTAVPVHPVAAPVVHHEVVAPIHHAVPVHHAVVAPVHHEVVHHDLVAHPTLVHPAPVVHATVPVHHEVVAPIHHPFALHGVADVHSVPVHHEVVHHDLVAPVHHQVVHHVAEPVAVHHQPHVVEHIVDDFDSHNIEDLDELHHSQLSGDDKPAGTTHEWHHDSHYDQEHFYDGPLHHGGLHGRYDDPMVTGSHFDPYDDEEHVPQFRHHSEEPLTHTEEYYYGAPIHHFKTDYHHTNVSHSCWKKAAGRTSGEPLSDCPDGMEKDGALCYEKCKAGFSGVGPVCWQDCPKESGFRDDGAYCYKPDAYGRGAGEVHNCGENCEQWGNFFYPKCHDDFHNVGCCVCSPNCPLGMVDIGISCAKSTYSRKSGKPLVCHKDQIQSGALCYPKCDHSAEGVGPVCWGKCPASTRECGPLCLGEDDICSEYIANEVKIAYQLVEDAAEHTTTGTVIDMQHIGAQVTFPNCPNW